jgi:hypothetical protein
MELEMKILYLGLGLASVCSRGYAYSWATEVSSIYCSKRGYIHGPLGCPLYTVAVENIYLNLCAVLGILSQKRIYTCTWPLYSRGVYISGPLGLPIYSIAGEHTYIPEPLGWPLYSRRGYIPGPLG